MKFGLTEFQLISIAVAVLAFLFRVTFLRALWKKKVSSKSDDVKDGKCVMVVHNYLF
jgi:hypothetical protein